MTLDSFESAADFVASKTPTHRSVTRVERLDKFAIRVDRRDPLKEHDLPTITVVAVRKDMFTEEAVEQILDVYPDLDGIVNSGKGSHYSGKARQQATEDGIALHTFGEYLGGLGDGAFRQHQDPTVAYALKAFAPHGKVTRVEQVCEKRIRLTRTNGLATVEFVPTSIYTLGVAELMDVLGVHPGVDAVVNFSDWNKYTQDAKQRALDVGVGLFSTSELFGALHLEGDDFTRYQPRQSR